MLTRIKTDVYFVLVASYSRPVRKTEDTGAYESRGGQKETSCSGKRESESKTKEKEAFVASFWRLLTIAYFLCTGAMNCNVRVSITPTSKRLPKS